MINVVVATAVSCLLHSTAYAASTGLFPSENQPPPPLTRVDNDSLPPLDTPPAQQAEPSPSRGPLRVVIPNIKQEKIATGQQSRPKRNPTATTAKPALLPPIQETVPVVATPAPVEPVAAAPVAPVVAAPIAQAPAPAAPVTTPAPTQDYSLANGVTIDAAYINTSFIYSTMAKFLAVPASWIVPAETRVAMSNDAGATPADTSPAAMNVASAANNFSDMEPAAGPAAIPPSGPNGVIIYPVPSVVAPIKTIEPTPSKLSSPAAPASTSTPAPTPAKTATAAQRTPTPSNFDVSPTNPTEPKPTLSAQSKSIINKLPPVSDPKPPALSSKDVNIEREREKPAFGGDVKINTHESKGIKVDVRQPSIDSSYELEKAYNALVAGKSDDAIRIYQDILTNDPNNNDALFGLASTYHRVGQLELARSLYGKLLARNPNHRDGLNNFLVLLAEEAPSEALQQMQKLEEKNPSFSPIPAQMAVIYKKLGKIDVAVEKMYRALSLSPENVTYRYNLAVMLDQAGEREKAADLYEQVLSSRDKGEVIPGDPQKIQQRLTFIRSNTK